MRIAVLASGSGTLLDALLEDGIPVSLVVTDRPSKAQVVGLLQAATSIQEATLSFIPKLIGVFLALVLFGGVTGGLLADYLREAASAIPLMAR